MNMYQHRQQRLLALIDSDYGGERVRFCDKTNISESRLAQLLSKTFRDGSAFTEKTARKLEVLANLPPLYFDQGVFDSDDGSAPTAIPFMKVDAIESLDPSLVQIPKVSLRLSAGINGFDVEPEHYDGTTTTVSADWIRRNGYDRDKLLAIRIRGESMETTFHEGDLVIINTADKVPVDGVVFAVNYEGAPVVKRLERDAGQWWLKSDNQNQQKFGRKVCQGDDCLIIGRVVRREGDRF